MIWIVRRLILWNIVLFSVSLLALTFSGCSSKDDQNKSKADSNSAENNATSPKSEADMNNQKQTKEAPSQGIIKLSQSQREANQPLKDNKKQGNVEEETSNKMTSKTVSSADAGDNIVISKEASELRQGDVVKDAGKAMDDEDPEVRLDMMESLVNQELSDANVLPIVSRALKNDKDERVREAAVEVLAFVNNPESDKLLILALADSDENVRRTVLDVAGKQEDNIRWDVLKEAMSSSHQDVKESIISVLIGLSNRNAVDLLVLGLKTSDMAFRDEVSSAINLLVSKEFNNYEDAKKWWDSNRNKYEEDLFEKDEQQIF